MWLCRSPRMSSSVIRRGSPSSAPSALASSSLPAVAPAALALCRASLQLPPVLPQLRRDVGEAESLVDLSLLARACMHAAGRVVADPVLGYVQSAPDRRFAQRRVVWARAGEVLQQVAELAGFGDLQVDADARVGTPLCPGLARGGHLLDLRQLGEALRASVVGFVVVAIRSMSFTLSVIRRADPASCTCVPGPPRSIRPAASVSPSSIACGSNRRLAARSGVSAGIRSSAANTLASNFGPSPFAVRSRCAKRSLAQLLDRVDFQLRIQQPRALGPEAWQSRHRDQAGQGTSRASAPSKESFRCRAA